jgi:putative membrane protein
MVQVCCSNADRALITSLYLLGLVVFSTPCCGFTGTRSKCGLVSREPNILRSRHKPLPSTRFYYMDSRPNFTTPASVGTNSVSSHYSDINSNITSARNVSEPDSIEAYALDIAIVLKKLRPQGTDPSIPTIFRASRCVPSMTTTWSFDDWKIHTSRWRYLNYIRTFPTSRLFRRIAPQLGILFVWSCVASWACAREVPMMTRAVLSLTPLSLVSTFVAALLTLRSNQGLSRLNEGRLALGQVVLYTRDMAQMIASYIYPKDPAIGLKSARHIAIFSWLLKEFLRGKEVNGSDDDLIYTMLDPVDANYVLQQRKKPVAVVTRLRQVFSHMIRKGQLTTSEASRLDHTVQQLNYCIMVTERIQASPIPPLYTAHTGRLLIFYLFFLPLSLRGSNIMNGIGTVITTMAVGFAMLGLDEISHLVEEPFRLMPLWHLSKNSMMDCADALVCQPPPLFYDEGEKSKDNKLATDDIYHYPKSHPTSETPSYW